MKHLAWILCIGALAMGCRDTSGDDDVDGGPGSDGGGGGEVTIYQVQDPAMDEGTAVTLRGVVVTAIDTYGGRTGSIWVAETEDHPTHGRAYSGVIVFLTDASAASLAVGDLVDVEGGVKDEFALNCDTVDCTDDTLTLTEISAPQGGSITLTKVGTGTVPAPVTLDPWALAADPQEAEKWESVLIRFEDVAVTTAPHGVSGSDSTLEAMSITGPVEVVSDLVAFDETIARDDCFAAVQGFGNFFFDWRLLPRNAGDFETGGDACLYEDDATKCMDGADDDYDGFADCEDFSCQTAVPECVQEATVVEVQNGTVATNARVRLTNVVVTAIGGTGDRNVFVQDADSTADYNGLLVYRGTMPPALDAQIVVGAVVTVEGRVTEFGDQVTELVVDPATSDVTFVSGGGTPAVRTGLTVADLNNPAEDGASEPYEGMLVELSNVAVVQMDAGFGQFSLGVAGTELLVDDVLFSVDPKPAPGTCYMTVRGVMDHAFSERKLYIRSAADLIPGGTCP